MVLRPDRGRGLGFLVILHNHHRRGTHLEIRHPGLHPADHRGHRDGLPRTLARGQRAGRPVRDDADTEQPCADDILLPLRHPRRDSLLRGRRREAREIWPLRQGHGGIGRGSSAGRGSQPPQPLQHMEILQGVDARQPHRAGHRRQRGAEDLGTRPRLHHPVQLWPLRIILVADSRHKGWSLGPSREGTHGGDIGDGRRRGAGEGFEAQPGRDAVCERLCRAIFRRT